MWPQVAPARRKEVVGAALGAVCTPAAAAAPLYTHTHTHTQKEMSRMRGAKHKAAAHPLGNGAIAKDVGKVWVVLLFLALGNPGTLWLPRVSHGLVRQPCCSACWVLGAGCWRCPPLLPPPLQCKACTTHGTRHTAHSARATQSASNQQPHGNPAPAAPGRNCAVVHSSSC